MGGPARLLALVARASSSSSLSGSSKPYLSGLRSAECWKLLYCWYRVYDYIGLISSRFLFLSAMGGCYGDI